MKIDKLKILEIAYSKNPNKVDVEELPANYSELHKNKIDYHINQRESTENKRCIHIFISVNPKDTKTGFIQYIASYKVEVKDITKEDLDDTNKILSWALFQVWDKIHFDYMRAMQDLSVPVAGFPITPLLPSIEENLEGGKKRE